MSHHHHHGHSHHHHGHSHAVGNNYNGIFLLGIGLNIAFIVVDFPMQDTMWAMLWG